MKKKGKMTSGVLSVLLSSAMLLSSLPVSAYGMEAQAFSAGEEIVEITDQTDAFQSEAAEEIALDEAGTFERAGETESILIDVNEENFPDENFRKYIQENFNVNSDGKLDVSIIQDINCKDRNISSLQGVGWFENLHWLDCSGNQLTSLDVSKNKELLRLNCQNNQIGELDLTYNSKLKSLNCMDNQLSSLDITHNQEMELAWCGKNQLTSLETGDNDVLEHLSCNENQLTSLDVSKNINITYLNCEKNKITSLDCSKNEKITHLICLGNNIDSLTLCQNENLKYLDCYENQLTSLDISGNKNLETLQCFDNKLTSLKIGENTKLKHVNCGKNQLTSLDLSCSEELKVLYCYDNQLKSLEIAPNAKLEVLVANGNQLSSLDLGDNIPDDYHCYVNELPIDISANSTYDLSTLPGKFDVNRASEWTGGSVNGNILTVDSGVEKVTYKYKVSTKADSDLTTKFTLLVSKSTEPTVTPTPEVPTVTPIPEEAPTVTPMPEVPTATPTPTPEEIPTITPMPEAPTVTPMPETPTPTPTPSEPIVIPPYIPIEPPVEPTPLPTEPPVSPTPSPIQPDDQDSLETKLEVEEGVQDVPEMLKENTELNTPEKIEEKLKNIVSEISGYIQENAVSYDVSLSISDDNGKTWEKATPENFPMNGLLVTLPYPKGIDPAKYDFVVIHMFTTNHFGKVPGETEQPAVTKTKEGLQFRVTGLSPITVAWKEAEEVPEPTAVVPVIKEVKVTGNSAEVILSEKCEGMEGYDYVISSDPNGVKSKKYDKVNKNVLTEKTTFRYIKEGTCYAFCHAWKKVNGKKEFTGWSEAYPFKISAVTPERPVITSVKATGSTVKVTYKASKNAEGYDVVLGKSVKKEYDGEKRPTGYGKLVKKNIKGNVVTVTFKNVPKGTYYAGLHAFNKTSNNGKKAFSPWSAAKKVTVK